MGKLPCEHNFCCHCVVQNLNLTKSFLTSKGTEQGPQNNQVCLTNSLWKMMAVTLPFHIANGLWAACATQLPHKHPLKSTQGLYRGSMRSTARSLTLFTCAVEKKRDKVTGRSGWDVQVTNEMQYVTWLGQVRQDSGKRSNGWRSVRPGRQKIWRSGVIVSGFFFFQKMVRNIRKCLSF